MIRLISMPKTFTEGIARKVCRLHMKILPHHMSPGKYKSNHKETRLHTDENGPNPEH